MKFNIIGAGRLGKNLALSLMTLKDTQLTAVCNRHLHTAITAVQELGAGLAVESLADLPAADITFITTPDDCIAEIATQLIHSNSIVVHCSGVLGSDVLAPLKKRGCLTASIHPFRAFRGNHVQAHAFQDCDCAAEGDARALALLIPLFTEMGARIVPISALKKHTYHAAAVMASNYLVTLAGCASELLTDAGFPQQQAKNMVEQMMQGSLGNLQNTAHVSDALTGPLARGDLNTIKRHLQGIHTPSIHALYRTAALATLPLTRLEDHTIQALRTLLDEA